MNKTLTVALSMCAGVAMVGAGVFASSTSTTSTTTTTVSDNARQGIMKQFKKFDGGGRMQSETIKAAIEANDYSKLSTKEQSKITKEQFAQMVTMNQARATHEAAILAAVKANDFIAFQKAHTDFKAIMDANKPADAPANNKTEPTTEQQKARFDELVSYYKTNGKLPEMKMGMGGHDRGGHDKGGMMMSDTIKAAMTSHQSSVEAAVKANDFTAFKKAHTDFKAIMEANKPSDMTDDKARPEPTDDELKQRFEKLVEYYKTNGKLPEMKMGMGGKKGEKGMMRGQKRSQTQSAQ